MKESELVKFENKEIGEIKGFVKDGEPWFLAGSICNALGLTNASESLRKIKEKRKSAGIEGVISSETLIETSGGKQKTAIIPEKILYELIFQSRKKKAYLFQTWVFDEVLPALRKHGEYRMEGKLIRKSLTDNLKDSGEAERMHGHAYSTYTKMIYKILGLTGKKRDEMTAEELEAVAHKENLAGALAREGKQYNEIKELIGG